MSFEFIKKLPTPEEIRNQYPLDAELQALKEKRDAEIRDVFTGKSDKFLAIIGPCSAENYRYLSDLLSYVAVGARSVEDQQHRLTVSGMDVPAGMKNPTSGDYSVMLNSIVAAQGAHRFIYRSWEVETTGNPLSHAILRGAVNKHGEAIPNYHYEDLRLLYDKYHAKNLANPAVIVDTNHSNSNKHYEQQVRIASEVLHSRQVDPELHSMVKGLMIESYIEPGNQKIGGDHIYGKSITDACLGWDESEKLLYTIAENC